MIGLSVVSEIFVLKLQDKSRLTHFFIVSWCNHRIVDVLDTFSELFSEHNFIRIIEGINVWWRWIIRSVSSFVLRCISWG